MSFVDGSNQTPDLALQLLQEGNSPHPWFDRAIMRMDGFMMPAIMDRDILTPAGSENAGEMWLLDGSGATASAWEQHTDVFALYYPQFDGTIIRDNWMFLPVKNGQRVWVLDENIIITRKNGNWFSHAAIANVDTTNTVQATAINAILDALQGHGYLDA